MKSKMYLASSIIAAAMIATMLTTSTIASAAPSWAVAIAASATQTTTKISTLTVTGSGDIPRKTSVAPDAVAGFAWADLDTAKVLVATIHPTFRDSAQNPDSWHMHAAQLAAGVNGHTFCIDSFFTNPVGGITIVGSKITVKVQNSLMPFATSDIDGAVGFVVNPESGCGAGLAVDITGSPVGLS